MFTSKILTYANTQFTAYENERHTYNNNNSIWTDN